MTLQYSAKARNPLRSNMRPKSPSRTPQSATKRNRYELHSSDEENDDGLDQGSPERRNDTSLDTTGTPNYGWNISNRSEANSRDLGWKPDLRKRNINESYSYSESSFHSDKIDRKKLPERRPEPQQTDSFTIVAVVLIILLIFLGVYVFGSLAAKKTPVQCPEFKELTKRFTHQDTLMWKSLKVGTEGVLNKDPTKPSVFLFAYNDKRGIDNVMLQIVNATASCMNSKNPIQLSSDALATDAMRRDSGEVIKAFKYQLQREGIMYVADINKVPIEAAKAFHAICDTVTPLVSRLVVYFTMQLEQYHGNMSTKEILKLVEQELENNWYKKDVINDNTLKALIGRITDQVFLLHSESEIA